ncbi:MAG: (deoxy)nucleoside triphosphate pyrophosphohydrolase [Terriglobales bacterium]
MSARPAAARITKRKRRRLGAIKQVAAAFILDHGKILICQRTRHQPMPLKWEFPGGKIESGEQPRDALRRELEEELGIDAKVGDEAARIRHTYARGGAVELRFFVVESFSGEIENRIFKDVRWATRKELPKYDFLEADAGLVKDIAAGKII